MELTEDDIKALEAKGATVTSKNVEFSFAGMVQLLNQVQQLIDINQAIANKNNTDLVNAVKSLTQAVEKKQFKPQDIKPLVDKINDFKIELPQPPKPVSYTFNIQRNSRGMMTGVTAKPEI